jgi:plastocyanin
VKRAAFHTAFAVALAASAACAKHHEPKTHHVEIHGMQFVPADLTVDVGDVIIWKNSDVVPHTVTAAKQAPEIFDSQQLTFGQEYTFKVTASGVHPYACTFHPTMHATITAR